MDVSSCKSQMRRCDNNDRAKCWLVNISQVRVSILNTVRHNNSSNLYISALGLSFLLMILGKSLPANTIRNRHGK